MDAAADKQPGALDGRTLRRVCSRYATGVAVIGAAGAQGRAVGLTVNSFASLSLAPPLILWSLARYLAQRRTVRTGRGFRRQRPACRPGALARHFATPAPDKFSGGPPPVPGRCALPRRCPGHAGLPRGARRSDRRPPAGGGRSRSCEAGEGEPLVFYGGGFVRIAASGPRPFAHGAGGSIDAPLPVVPGLRRRSPSPDRRPIAYRRRDGLPCSGRPACHLFRIAATARAGIRFTSCPFNWVGYSVRLPVSLGGGWPFWPRAVLFAQARAARSHALAADSCGIPQITQFRVSISPGQSQLGMEQTMSLGLVGRKVGMTRISRTTVIRSRYRGRGRRQPRDANQDGRDRRLHRGSSHLRQATRQPRHQAAGGSPRQSRRGSRRNHPRIPYRCSQGCRTAAGGSLSVDLFEVGQKIDVQGVTIGKRLRRYHQALPLRFRPCHPR